MMGPAHRLAGALAGAGWAVYVQAPYPVVLMTAGVATLTAAGPLSPDMDQSRWWQWIPGRGGPLRHRGITHWPGLPLLALLLVPAVPPVARLVVIAALLGWSSHLIADALTVGKIPLSPLGGLRVGLPFRTGGVFESGVASPIMVIALLWLLIARPGIDLVRSFT